MRKRKVILSLGILCWMSSCCVTYNVSAATTLNAVTVRANKAVEEAKWNPQQVSIITHEDIEKKQAKSVEDIIFTETGVSRTVDAMGRVGVSIRGAEARHTLILVDGQQVLGDFDKYSGAADEVMRLGTENVERIEVIQGAASAKYGSDAIGGVINIITKKANHTPTLQLNGEASKRKVDNDIAPFKNYFLRADSGNMGKLKISISGSKRDIMPVLAHKQLSFSDKKEASKFEPNVLRYYGDASDIGLMASYDVNKNNIVNLRINRYAEDLMRDVKRSTEETAPQQHFKREASRNTGSLTWTGKSKSTNWEVETNYSKIQEDDVSLITYGGRSAYEGKNELRYIDNIDHKQMSIKASANTSLNDEHVLTYGFGYTKEDGEGSRLKHSPQTSKMYIDPWDYDKSLLVERLDRWVAEPGDTRPRVFSHIHDYKTIINDKGVPEWDYNYEYYGTIKDNPDTKADFTYDDYVKFYVKAKGTQKPSKSPYTGSITAPDGSDTMSEKEYNNFIAFEKKLIRDNPEMAKRGNIVLDYYKQGQSETEYDKAPRFNKDEEGRPLRFMEEYRNRSQRLDVGKGTIKKHNFFVSDTWQVNDNTTIVPIIRYDYSSLFGSHVSSTLGFTHSVHGNPHRRFKANVGTGYTEPGMGELWYDWEMYGSHPVGWGVAKMGWYWFGNPNLKPEKSVNFDISLEGENKNTYARLGLFHNRIKDYMTVYFTGKLYDFAPYLPKDQKWQKAPDMIYSFKNIGKAEITGLELEVKHKFTKHWATKLGYTYLHAINKSDPDMPRQLLDKPLHKIDIGLTYTNDASGWNGQLWGDYYIDMLDSNTVSNNANYYYDDGSTTYANKSNQSYEKKTFGIWNLIVQKQIGKDSLMYVGINNLFNHRDDDRATQERVYRFGVNLKFGSDGKIDKKQKIETSVHSKALEEITPTFITHPNIMTDSLHLWGDYRARFINVGGLNRPQPMYRGEYTYGNKKHPASYVNTGTNNMKDNADHGFEQRIRIGVDAKLNKNTQLTVIGSATGDPTVSDSANIVNAKSFNHQQLDRIDITHSTHKWDVSIGRLHEKIGVTGYWFNKEFDGIRTVWTHKTNQLRIGYGDFSHNTGVFDSPYTHMICGEIKRPPTVAEFLGLKYDRFPNDNLSASKSGSRELPKNSTDKPDPDSMTGIYESQYKGKTNKAFFYQQLTEAKTVEERVAILKRMHAIIKQAYGNDMANKRIPLNVNINTMAMFKLKNKKTGEVIYKKTAIPFDVTEQAWDSQEEKLAKRALRNKFTVPLSDEKALVTDGSYINDHAEQFINAVVSEGEKAAKTYLGYLNDGSSDRVIRVAPGTTDEAIKNGEITTYEKDESINISDYEYLGVVKLFKEDYRDYKGSENGASKYVRKSTNLQNQLIDDNYKTGDIKSDNTTMNPMLDQYFEELCRVVENSENNNTLPRAALGKLTGNFINTYGVILNQDRIPPIHRAMFVQYKKQVSNRLGIQAWYVHGGSDTFQTFQNATLSGNSNTEFKTLANVIGIGAEYKFNNLTKISFDYGQNRTDFGRYMNGHTNYYHERGMGDFDVLGYSSGNTPKFWTMRLDIGQSNMNIPNSWDAFVDYKYFDHGAYFGGTGHEGISNRYLDGIKSFTFGMSYVPRKDVLLQAFYTFDAKGTKNRDTLFGPEAFSLGNYSTVQMTYKF
ncbi:TonB-dependent receptor plug domain-containing protein [Veillonella montpellierensis]|uniref:TonB-dependent receptor plug domain-containing protein n=1 Tax=Veillonella montpellierensis TaxID=187328 RepID=UPI0023F92F91|nr:TonB-dependent receptor [Veillonella montpellierensis]